MKLIVLAALIGACMGGALPAFVPPQYRLAPSYYADTRPRSYEGNAAILRSDSEVNEQGFRYAYETENGIKADAAGVEADGIQSQGGYSYTGDDGQVYAVRYTADANGFQPQGAHLPTPPPIPEAIAKSLALNARDEAAGIYDDGSYRDAKYTPVDVARAQFAYNPGRYVAPAFRRFYNKY